MTRGDEELTAFLRRAAGYSLTGDVREQCLFFLHGDGATGKSTFLAALRDVFGPYATKAAPNLLMAETHEPHPTGLADLVAMRFVVLNEIDEGRRWNESLVKDLTGGDALKARRMHENFFEFPPTHKLWIAGNHRPTVRGTDEGIWRRMRLVPFLAQVPEAERDKDLPEKLAVERAGILRWAVEGCREWQDTGLRPPAAVTRTTSQYRKEMDVVGRFISDECQQEAGAKVRSKDLFAAFERWCGENGETTESKKSFGSSLSKRGFEKGREGAGRLWVGLRLRRDGEV